MTTVPLNKLYNCYTCIGVFLFLFSYDHGVLRRDYKYFTYTIAAIMLVEGLYKHSEQLECSWHMPSLSYKGYSCMLSPTHRWP